MGDSKSESVIKLLEEFFSLVGWPLNLRSDGGPCFTAKDFEKFCFENGIRHCKSAPGHHESNGGAECGVREIKGLMKTTNKTGISLQRLISQLNSMERAGGLGCPNQLFFGRSLRLPGIPALGREDFDEQAAARARHNLREKERERANKGRKPALTNFKVGDKVRFYCENKKHWRNFGTVTEVVFHGASFPQSYMIKSLEGPLFLRPATHCMSA